jgi:hypothetical protein
LIIRQPSTTGAPSTRVTSAAAFAKSLKTKNGNAGSIAKVFTPNSAMGATVRA